MENDSNYQNAEQVEAAKAPDPGGIEPGPACHAAGCEPPGAEQVGAERGHAGGGEARPHQPPVRRVLKGFCYSYRKV